MINAKKQRKTTEWERLEISSRKLESISCKDGLDTGQKWYGPKEAEDIKKRWQEYAEEQYKKELHDPDNPDGVITHLEPDILECEVKWALGSITMNKASEGDVIPNELFQILKEDTVIVLHSMCLSKFGKLSSGYRTEKGQFQFQSQRKTMPKNAQTTALLHSSHTLVK